MNPPPKQGISAKTGLHAWYQQTIVAQIFIDIHTNIIILVFSVIPIACLENDLLLSIGREIMGSHHRKATFFKKVLFFSGKSGYNIGVMCSFLLFAEDFRDLSARFAIAIYPREGTETASDGPNCWNREHCNLSPRGDGNFQKSRSHFSSFLHRNLSPQGAKKSTSATGVCQQRRCFAFSYILFYRLGAVPAGIVFVTGSALTPCGTSGFMGRISCR